MFCGECQERVEDAGCEWFSSHLMPRQIQESTHPHLLPDSEPPVANLPLPDDYSLASSLDAAAAVFKRAAAEGARVLVCAGAGISVDSGVPDFRGPNGFYRVNGQDVTLNDINFHDPAKLGLAWGKSLIMRRAFRRHAPHEGYTKLLEVLTPTTHHPPPHHPTTPPPHHPTTPPPYPLVRLLPTSRLKR